jgi:hypothetical protein
MQSTWANPVQTGNNSGLLSNIRPVRRALLLNNAAHMHMINRMKHIILSLVCAGTLAFSAPAHAADCFADYKAKQDDPLRLHYGVAQITGGCQINLAGAELRARLAAQGWTLLSIVSTFDATGLAERKDSAGSYYLRF